MSAIAGIWRFDGGADVLRIAERMANSLSVFGPDRHGLWQTPDRQLALMWRQFAVLPEDIHDRQPLYSPDGVHALVADGRIDNIEELAAELDLGSVRDLPDAAIIIAAYRKWDAACHQSAAAFLLDDRIPLDDRFEVATRILCPGPETSRTVH